MALTSKSTVVASAIVDLIEEAVEDEELAIDEVYYGDHNNIPVGTAVAVTPGTKRRELAGVAGPGGRSMVYMEIVVLIYYSVVTDEATARLHVDQLAESIEDLLHADTTLNGIIIHGFVTEWIPGVIHKPKSMFRVVQLTYTAQTKVNITQTP